MAPTTIPSPVYVALLAGGSGQRFRESLPSSLTVNQNLPKTLWPLFGFPVFLHSVAKLSRLPNFEKMVITCPAEFKKNFEGYFKADIPAQLKKQNAIDSQSSILKLLGIEESQRQQVLAEINELYAARKIELVVGGATRSLSFREAVSSFYSSQKNQINQINQASPKREQQPIYLIHDAARPDFNLQDMPSLIEHANKKGCATLYQKVTDTIFDQGSNHYPDRNNLLAIQTPQALNSQAVTAIRQLDPQKMEQHTDESSLARQLGFEIEFVLSTNSNAKLTNYNDFKILEAVYT